MCLALFILFWAVKDANPSNIFNEDDFGLFEDFMEMKRHFEHENALVPKLRLERTKLSSIKTNLEKVMSQQQGFWIYFIFLYVPYPFHSSSSL